MVKLGYSPREFCFQSLNPWPLCYLASLILNTVFSFPLGLPSIFNLSTSVRQIVFLITAHNLLGPNPDISVWPHLKPLCLHSNPMDLTFGSWTCQACPCLQDFVLAALSARIPFPRFLDVPSCYSNPNLNGVPQRGLLPPHQSSSPPPQPFLSHHVVSFLFMALINT